MSTAGDLASIRGLATPDPRGDRRSPRGSWAQERVWLPGVGTEVRNAEAGASWPGVGTAARDVRTGAAWAGGRTSARHGGLGTAGTCLRSRPGHHCAGAVGASLRARARHGYTRAVRTCGGSGARRHGRRAVRASGRGRARRTCGGTIGTCDGACGGALDATRRRRIGSGERCKGDRRRSSAGEEDLCHEVFSHGGWVPPANLLETSMLRRIRCPHGCYRITRDHHRSDAPRNPRRAVRPGIPARMVPGPPGDRSPRT